MSKPSNKALFSQRVGVDTSDEYVKPKLAEAAAALAETRKAEAAREDPARKAVAVELPEGERYDFRDMAEPARMVERIRAVLYDRRLSHGERCAAAALVLAFAGGENVQLVSVKRILPDDKGYSAKLRNKALAALSEAGLIRFEVAAGRGCMVELLF